MAAVRKRRPRRRSPPASRGSWTDCRRSHDGRLAAGGDDHVRTGVRQDPLDVSVRADALLPPALHERMRDGRAALTVDGAATPCPIRSRRPSPWSGHAEGMKQQAHFITLSTPDLDAARAFYCDGLGWTALLDVPGEIIFFQVAPATGPRALPGGQVRRRHGGHTGRRPARRAHPVAQRGLPRRRRRRRTACGRGGRARSSSRRRPPPSAATTATSPTPTAWSGRSATTRAGGSTRPARSISAVDDRLIDRSI